MSQNAAELATEAEHPHPKTQKAAQPHKAEPAPQPASDVFDDECGDNGRGGGSVKKAT